MHMRLQNVDSLTGNYWSRYNYSQLDGSDAIKLHSTGGERCLYQLLINACVASLFSPSYVGMEGPACTDYLNSQR